MIKIPIPFINGFLFVISINVFLSCSYAANNVPFNVKNNIKKSLQDNKSAPSKINIAKNLSIPVTFDATKKGNGAINLNSLLIRVFDQHDDGVVYENDFLNMETKDLNNDDIKEIIFTGIIKHTGEKEIDPVSFEPITNIYQLNCSTGIITSLYSSSDYPIEIRNAQKTPIQCKR